ncbi:MAG: energy-coupled thiamine transporter ThiT [Gemmiger sp.]
MILLDYVLAFTLLGLAGAIAKPFKNRLVGGPSARQRCAALLCSFLSGVLIWGNLSDGLPLDLQPDYNGSYAVPETILTTVAAVLIYKAALQRRRAGAVSAK